MYHSTAGSRRSIWSSAELVQVGMAYADEYMMNVANFLLIAVIPPPLPFLPCHDNTGQFVQPKICIVLDILSRMTEHDRVGGGKGVLPIVWAE